SYRCAGRVGVGGQPIARARGSDGSRAGRPSGHRDGTGGARSGASDRPWWTRSRVAGRWHRPREGLLGAAWGPGLEGDDSSPTSLYVGPQPVCDTGSSVVRRAVPPPEALTSWVRLFPPAWGQGIGTSCGSTAHHKDHLAQDPRRRLTPSSPALVVPDVSPSLI